MQMLLHKQKKNPHSSKGNRLLITVNVLGSAGPLRFLVNEDELVAAVIDTTLKSYAREGRLPVLGSDLNNFRLYSANAGTDALSHWETIGSRGGRNFVLFKKPQRQLEATKGNIIARKGSSRWKAWLHRSLNLKISSH
ncbi:PREDICTED: uncharacterized protein At4g22758-like [Nelumbo nucifera]|uniref:DUF7054 domain-containing protein n=2 Tax=Nelumbo nucifera TaxID=4432 RepID=A0A822YST5_NELNU|nr:PREDICTED: uncharacterized protein At4g22758-like [Nelumbo nucifera]DAD35709.1 TPA_asm: hypothetical protein HUJ06_006349 [Nelumbo nucifera]DAD35712.1 TPA_asm: hypothetical protein HUJ06_006352 [Nelumbo nucifera]